MPVLAALIATVALSACGGSSPKQPPTKTASPPSTTPANKSTPTIKPIAAVEDVAGVANDKMRVTVYDLRRNGPFLTLDFGIQCTDPNTGCSTIRDFAPPIENADQEAVDSYTAEGISLVDPVANKQYQPVLDAQQHPDSSALPLSIQDSAIHLAWVTFPAPPTTVTSLDLLLPGGGPMIPGVPISTGGPPAASEVGPTAVPAPAGRFSQPASSTSTAGLTLPVNDLVLTVGNPAGSDSESADKDTLSLRADVLFQFDKSSLTPKASAILSNVASQIKARAVGPVQVDGYTDSIGSDAVNIPLSQARAQSVVNALRGQTPGVTYHAAGFGSADPVAPNTQANGADNPAGRALNRRVTVSFAVKAPTKPAPPPAAPTPPPTAAGGSPQTVSYTAAVLGSGTSTYGVTVDRLFRSGDMAVAELTISCQGQTSGTCTTATDFAGTPTAPPLPADQAPPGQLIRTALDALSGVYLVDSSGAEYIPVTDHSGSPLTTQLNSNTSQGDSFAAWLYFPAPPSTTTTVTIALPGGSTRIPNVPISSPPAP